MIRINAVWRFFALAIAGLCLFTATSLYAATPDLLPAQSNAVGADTDAVLAANPASDLDVGRAHYAAGRFSEAIAAWQAAAAAYAASGAVSRQALSLSYLSLAHQALSQWDAAQEAIADSLALLHQTSEGSSPIIWAHALNTQASLSLQLGQPQSALETWEQAQTFYQAANDNVGVIGSQINQTQALQQLGFYQRSRKQLVEINTQLSQSPDSNLKISALRNLGISLQRVGDYRDAYDVFEASLDITSRIDAPVERNAILLDIGQLATMLESYETALTYFETAEQEAATPLSQLQAQLGRLDVYIMLRQWQTARGLLPQIRQQLAELPPSHPSVYGTINLVSHLAQYDKQYQLLSVHELSHLVADAIQAAQDLGDSRAEAHGIKQLGQLYIQTGQQAEAITLMQKALLIARTQQSNDILAQAAWQLGKLLKEDDKPAAAADAYREAIAALQSLRGDLITVNRDVQFSFQNNVEPIYREYIALLLSNEPTQENLSQARQLIESLQLAELDNFFRQACLDTQPEEIDQIDPKAAIIYPIILPDQIAVILSQADQPLRYYATPVEQTEVEATLSHLLELLHPSSDHRERLQVSQQVYRWLIQPIEQQQDLANAETLVFVLDGLLRNIPMSALYDGEQYLIEKYALALSPGLQLMAAQPLDQANLQTVIGGISEARSGFSALPEVVSEVTEIAQMVNASPLLNEAFTNRAVAEQLQNSSADVVHLATHGQFSSNQEDTFLLTWEGQINIWGLAELLENRAGRNGRAVELLVLSACNTATGDNRAVLGLAGLAVKSGARSTIATLWPVKDQAAALAMIRFYEALQQPNMTKAEALRQAQLTLLNDPSYNDPFFWSSYVLVGNWL
ncbi:MAG: CHAT domain-containing protein [Cyanobacteria bacterium P01_D01_bin.6]